MTRLRHNMERPQGEPSNLVGRYREILAELRQNRDAIYPPSRSPRAQRKLIGAVAAATAVCAYFAPAMAADAAFGVTGAELELYGRGYTHPHKVDIEYVGAQIPCDSDDTVYYEFTAETPEHTNAFVLVCKGIFTDPSIVTIE